MRRRVFGAGDLSVLILRNVDNWDPAMAGDLREIVSLCRPDEGLLLVMHMTDRSLFTPGFLTPWVDDPGKPTRWHLDLFDSVGLILDDRAEPVSVKGTMGSAPPDTLGHLLGVPDIEGKRVRRALLDRGWSLEHLLSVAILGSTPTAAVRLAVPHPESRFDAFAARVRPIQAVFAPGSQRPLEVGRVQRLFDWADTAAGLGCDETDDFREVIGRVGARRALAATLADLMNGADPEDGEADPAAHIARLLACGEIHHLTEAVHHLGFDLSGTGGGRDSPAPDLWRVVFHIQAATFLLDERLTLAPDIPDPAPVLEARDRLAHTLRHDGIRSASDTTARPVLVLAYAAALDLSARIAAAGSAPPFDPAFDLDRVRDPASGRSAEALVRSDIAITVRSLRGLDQGYGRALLEEKLRFDWSALPEDWKAGLRQSLGDEKWTLTDLFLAARDDTQVWGLIEKHAPAPATLALGLAGACVRALDAQAPTSEERLEALATVAGLLEDLRTAAPPPTGKPHPLALPPTHGSVGRVRFLLSLIQDPDNRARMVDMVRRARPLPHVPVEGIALGAIGPINQRLDHIAEIDLKTATESGNSKPQVADTDDETEAVV